MSTANCRTTARKPSTPGWPQTPMQAAQVAAWRAQADSIRARYGNVANEPVPERLQLDRIIRDRSDARWTVRSMTAMAATILLAFVDRRRRRLVRAWRGVG